MLPLVFWGGLLCFLGLRFLDGWYNITSGSGLEFLGWMGVWFGWVVGLVVVLVFRVGFLVPVVCGVGGLAYGWFGFGLIQGWLVGFTGFVSLASMAV